MARLTLICVALALMIGVAFCDDVNEQQISKMSRDELVAQLTQTQKEAARTKTQLASAHSRIKELDMQLQQQHDTSRVNEKQRVAAERGNKDAMKKKEAAKRAQKLKKKQKLEDVLMEHTAEFVAMKIAKKYSDKDLKTQKTAVMKATKKAARAGAVGPLRKVARAVVAAAVKKARKDAKKAGKDDRHTMHKLSMKAAKAAFRKIMTKQNALVKKTVDKVTKKAFAKYPAAMELAEDEEPQHFVAPPSIHIGLLDDEEDSQADASEVVPEH